MVGGASPTWRAGTLVPTIPIPPHRTVFGHSHLKNQSTESTLTPIHQLTTPILISFCSFCHEEFSSSIYAPRHPSGVALLCRTCIRHLSAKHMGCRHSCACLSRVCTSKCGVEDDTGSPGPGLDPETSRFLSPERGRMAGRDQCCRAPLESPTALCPTTQDRRNGSFVQISVYRLLYSCSD
jgi:hypothetical protein